MTLADRHPAVPIPRDQDDHETYGQEVVAFTSAQTREERSRAFAAIVESHWNAVTRYCSAELNNDHHAAEDAAAETFALAWDKLQGIETPRAVRSWLFTVAKRQCLRIQRLKSREIGNLPAAVPEKSAPRTHDGESGREWLNLLVAMLPPEEQRFHDLCYQLELRGRELAVALGEDPEKRAKVDKMVHRHNTWIRGAIEAEIVVREGQYQSQCPELARILEEAGHVVPPSGVMPLELGKKVANHIGRCHKCGDDVERGKRRYSALVLLPALGLWGLLGRRGNDNAVEPASFSTADPGEARFEDDVPRPDGAKRGVRGRALGWSVAVGVVIILIVALTMRSGDGADLSLSPHPDPASPTEPAAVPDGSGGLDPSGRNRREGQGNGDHGGAPGPSAPGANPDRLPSDPSVAPPPPPPGVLAVAPTSLTLPLYATTATVTISGGSALSWTAASTDPAVSTTPASGAVAPGKPAQLKITVNRGATAKPGAGFVVTSGTGQRMPVAVHWPTPGKVGVTAPRIDLGYQAATATFSVTATNGNLNWSASSPHPAVAVSPAGGSLTAGKGALVTVRLARPISTGGDVPLRVTTPDAQQVTVMVHWLATPGTLRTSTNAVHIGASDSTARFTVGVSSGTNTWTATLSAPSCTAPTCRLTISRTSGSGTAEITVTLWPHPSSVDPAAHAHGQITLTTPDGQRLTIDVTWDPYEPG
ncbi:sigma factor [Amycolatopsis sp. NPDC051128]|uniref:BACON domain-containing protein n=1 Tax=Amycolatopsis sp. NPDC051128 TaxID=3155412 RepID=UPI0034471810